MINHTHARRETLINLQIKKQLHLFSPCIGTSRGLIGGAEVLAPSTSINSNSQQCHCTELTFRSQSLRSNGNQITPELKLLSHIAPEAKLSYHRTKIPRISFSPVQGFWFSLHFLSNQTALGRVEGIPADFVAIVNGELNFRGVRREDKFRKLEGIWGCLG
jgi:hypothetical protein